MSDKKKGRLTEGFVPPKAPKKPEGIEKGFVPPPPPKEPPPKPLNEKK